MMIVSVARRRIASSAASHRLIDRRWTTSGAAMGGMYGLHQDLIRELGALDTASLCDADKTLLSNHGEKTATLMSSSSSRPYTGIRLLSPSIRPIISNPHTRREWQQRPPTMVGWARTVQCTRRNDFLAVLRGLVEAQAGEVLVVNTSDSTHAVAGELFVTEALRRQVRGLVVDGPVRDTAQLRSLLDDGTNNIWVYASSICPYSGTTQSPGEVQISVTCGGVPVHPGDIVVGDDDGLLVGSIETFAALLPLAQGIVEAESKLRAGLVEGKSIESMTNCREHIQKRLTKAESSLEFRV